MLTCAISIADDFRALQIFLIPLIVLSFSSLMTFFCQKIIRDNSPQKPRVRKPHIYEFDLLRAFCALGIAAFHYSFDLKTGYRPFYTIMGMGWGDLFVTIFFLLSGASLIYNYPEIRSIKELKVFYAKRFLGLMPAYYLAFCWYYVSHSAPGRNYFYGGSLKKILLTLVGMDGYFYQVEPNYYQVGEWFTGMIIMLYLAYPLLLLALKKIRTTVAAWIILLVLYGLMLNLHGSPIATWNNPALCLIPFFLGMNLIRFQFYGTRNFRIAGVLLFIQIVIVKKVQLPFQPYIAEHFFAFALFVLLSWLGTYVMKVPGLSALISAIGSVSYGIFLVQHKVADKVALTLEPASTSENLAFLFLAFLVIIVEAALLTYAQKKYTAFFKKLSVCTVR
ncbi:MAG: acyltransferase family protein [Eubacterium sp.]|nr:acyltransferase family protein [Eubacterium sp.]